MEEKNNRKKQSLVITRSLNSVNNVSNKFKSRSEAMIGRGENLGEFKMRLGHFLFTLCTLKIFNGTKENH